MEYQFRVLESWPGERTRTRLRSSFRTAWQKTLDLLERELKFLSARQVVIQADCDASEIRLDGMIGFRVLGGWRRHALTLQTWLQIERLSHSMPVVNGRLIPDREFLTRVAGVLALAWRRPVSATIAYQVWHVAWRWMDVQRERAEQAADVAYWYGIDPFGLTLEQHAGLHANLPRVQAQARLAAGQFDPCDYEAMYHLTLLATGDEQAALAARARGIRAMMDRGMRGGGR